MSDTPRTDFYAGYIDSGGWWQHSCDGEFVQVHDARQLERELNEYRALLVRLYNDINVLHNGEAIRELNKKFRDKNFN